jgi:DNA polymerase-3 subunit epsilon
VDGVTRLVPGTRYRAIGPRADAQEVLVVERDDEAGVYRTMGTRQAAPVIRFGCERFWEEIAAVELLPAPVTWHDGRLVAFDLETTSPKPEEARIVTAAIAVCGGGQATECLTWLADPGVPIPDEAAEIHGVTTEQAQAEGRPVAEVIAEVIERLTLGCAQGWPLVIFNGRYDLTVLDREARRHGIPTLSDRQVDVLVIDPLVIDKHLHRYRKGSRKLDAQAAHYGATLDNAHDAAADALAAARVAWCIGKRGEVIRRVRGRSEAIELASLKREWEAVRHDLRALHAAQVRWALAERDRFAQYKRSVGEAEEADRIAAERGWPTLELPLEAAA